MATTTDTAADTLLMLEERLARIDALINGDSQRDNVAVGHPEPAASASARLRVLERTLKALAAKSYAVSDLLQLQKQSPALFHPTDARHVPNTLPTAALAQLVLAHEQQYRTTTSQLTTLNENKDIPDPSSLTKLIALQPRIDALEARQEQQAKQFAEIRAKSASLVEQWYESGILDMGERWADWEERLRDCEILVRRKEAAKRREEDLP